MTDNQITYTQTIKNRGILLFFAVLMCVITVVFVVWNCFLSFPEEGMVCLAAGIHIAFAFVGLMFLLIIYLNRYNRTKDVVCLFMIFCAEVLAVNCQSTRDLLGGGTASVGLCEVLFCVTSICQFIYGMLFIQYAFYYSPKKKADKGICRVVFIANIFLIVMYLTNRLHGMLYYVEDGKIIDNVGPVYLLQYCLFILTFAYLIFRCNISSRNKKINLIFIIVGILADILTAFLDLYIVPEVIMIQTIVLYATISITNMDTLDAERLTMLSDAERASKIQSDILNDNFSEAGDGVELYALMKPAQYVGGDVYDFHRIDNENVAVFVGDVSDHGMASALFAAEAISIFRGLIQSGSNPEHVMRKLNEQLCKYNNSQYFMTAILAIYNLEKGIVSYVNAGHGYGLVAGTEGAEAIDHRNADRVLGVFETVDYRVKRLNVKPGDTIIIYTDGIAEVKDRDSREFGMKGVMEIASQRLDSPKEYCEKIIEAAETFSCTSTREDDMTVLGIRITESANAKADRKAQEAAESGVNIAEVNMTGGTVHITLAGDLNSRTAGESEQHIMSSLEGQEFSEIVIDCADLRMISSIGIRILIKLAQMLPSEAGLHMINCNDTVKEILEITGLDNFME